jgi:hypothetical protein
MRAADTVAGSEAEQGNGALDAPRFSTNRAVEEYTLQHYLPATSAYFDRAANNGQIGVAIVNWHHALAQKWPALRFGEVKVQRADGQHVFQAQVYLDDLDPEAVRVELYADGAYGAAPERVRMERVRRMVGATNGYLYGAAVPDPPGDGLHGAIDTASRPSGGSTGRLPHPLAEVIQRRLRVRAKTPWRVRTAVARGNDCSSVNG